MAGSRKRSASAFSMHRIISLPDNFTVPSSPASQFLYCARANFPTLGVPSERNRRSDFWLIASVDRAVSKAVIRGRIRVGVIVLCVLGITISANAQSTFGSIVGGVHDTTQAVVPEASVKVRSLDDNSIRSATSDQNGSFEFVNLKPGHYAVSAEAQGFAEFLVPSAELTARQTLHVPSNGERSHRSTTEPYPPAFNSVSTCLAISFRVSNTPVP